VREDQYIGLNERAETFLNNGKKVLVYSEERTRTYPDGRVEQDTKEVKAGYETTRSGESVRGMFDDYQVNEYTVFETGRKYVEFVQAKPWSSGPMFFLALKDAATGEVVKESLWADDEIEEML